MKRGRPIGAKDKNLRKKTTHKVHVFEEQVIMKNVCDQSKVDKQKASEDTHDEEQMTKEISLNYSNSIGNWDRKKIIINNVFAYKVALHIVNEDPEPKSLEECRHRNDWPKWKDAIQAELKSLKNR